MPGELEPVEFPEQSDFVAFIARLMELGHDRIALDPGTNVRTPPIKRFFEWFRERQ